MNLKELKEAIYREAQGVGDYLGEKDIAAILNEAQRNLALYSRELKIREAEAIGGKVTLPRDCHVLRDVAYEGNPLLPYPEETVPMQRTGKPQYYFLAEDDIYLIPSPEDRDTVTLYYNPSPKVMEDDYDNLPFKGSEDVTIAYALKRIFALMGDVTSAAQWETLYTIRMQEYLQRVNSANYRKERVRMTLRW